MSSAEGDLVRALRGRNRGSLPPWFRQARADASPDGGTRVVVVVAPGAKEKAVRALEETGRLRQSSWDGWAPVVVRDDEPGLSGLLDVVAPSRTTSLLVGGLMGVVVGWWLRGRARAGWDATVGRAKSALRR